MDNYNPMSTRMNGLEPTCEWQPFLKIGRVYGYDNEVHWLPDEVMDLLEDRWVSLLRVWTVTFVNINPWVRPLSLANSKLHRGVWDILIEPMFWLRAHPRALLSPMDLTRPMVWLVDWCGSYSCNAPFQVDWVQPSFPPILAPTPTCQKYVQF